MLQCGAKDEGATQLPGLGGLLWNWEAVASCLQFLDDFQLHSGIINTKRQTQTAQHNKP